MPFPPTKTKFVRPLCESNNTGNVYANLTSPIPPVIENSNFPGTPNRTGDNLKHLNEMKSKQLNSLNSVHSKLFAEVEEIQKWKTAVEMESRQKNKKVEELLKTIESQRKVVLDLQLQNENLSYRLREEIQQRTFVIEKLHSSKELCAALKKHYKSLQEQFDYRNKIEDMINIADTKRVKAIEVLENKYEKACIEHSESVGYLNDALATETNKSLNLKEALEREVSLYENEKQSLCTLLNNSHLENERISKEIEEEVNKSRTLLQEKNELKLSLEKSEKLNDHYLSSIKEMERQLKVSEEDNLEIEKRYLAENLQNTELKKIYEECLENAKNSKLESEEKLLVLRQTTEELEYKYSELFKRIEEEKQKNADLISSLKKSEDDICQLKSIILAANDEISSLDVLKNEFNDLKENVSKLLDEKTELISVLDITKEELSKYKSENEINIKLHEEKVEEFLKVIAEYEAKVDVKEKEIFNFKENSIDLNLKYKKLEEDNLCTSELVLAKEKEIEKLEGLLEEREKMLKDLRKDNSVLKESFEAEKASVRVCLECEGLKEKVNELENVKDLLKKSEEEVFIHKSGTIEILKMLNESEKNSNEDRISKQKEIIEYKKQVRQLESDIELKYVELELFDNLSSENLKLKKDLEELEIKRNSENLKLKKDFEELEIKRDSENLKLKNDLEKLEIKLKKLDFSDTPVKQNDAKLAKSPKQAKSLKAKSPKQAIESKSLNKVIVTKSPNKVIVTKSPKQTIATKSPVQVTVPDQPKETNKEISNAQKPTNAELIKICVARAKNRKMKEKDLDFSTSKGSSFKKNIPSSAFDYSEPEEPKLSKFDDCFEKNTKKSSDKENIAWEAGSNESEYFDMSFYAKVDDAVPKDQDVGKNKSLSSSQQKRESQDNIFENNVAKKQRTVPSKNQASYKPHIWTQGLRTPDKSYRDTLVEDLMNKRATPLAPKISTPRRFFKSSPFERDEKFKKPKVPWI